MIPARYLETITSIGSPYTTHAIICAAISSYSDSVTITHAANPLFVLCLFGS